MTDITKQLASALRMYLSAYQAMDQAAAIRAADRAAHESLAAYAAAQSAPSERAQGEREALSDGGSVYNAIARAMDMASMLAGAVAHNRTDDAAAYSASLRRKLWRISELAQARAALASQPAAGVALTPEAVDLIAADGMRSATGGIYATQVYAFADAVIAEFCRANGITAPAAQEKP